MTQVCFSLDRGLITGFRVSGHSGYAPSGYDIVCAAVSSAVRLVECAISDVMGLHPLVQVGEADVHLSLPSSDEAMQCQDLLRALQLHIRALVKEYPKYIEIMEVQHHA